MSQTRTSHLQIMHHLLKYIRKCLIQGLFFSMQCTLTLIAYVDADWGGCLDTIHRVLCLLGDSLISWKAKKWDTVSKSSIEAKYQALACITSELLWLQSLFKNIGLEIPSSLVFCGNNSTIQLASNLAQHERSKHINIDCHFIREYVPFGYL